MASAPRVSSIARLTAATIAVALGAAAFAIAFRGTLQAGLQLFLGTPNVLVGFSNLPAWQRVSLPAVGGLLAGGLLTVVARASSAQGVGSILEAVTLGRGRVSFRTGVWKSLGSLLAIVSGGSIGREGPIVQVGAGIGAAIGRWASLGPRELRLVMAAGTAAGFAAAYNTPLAAILFVLEIVTGAVTVELVLPVAVAAAIATGVTRLVVGGGPLYGARTFAVVSSSEYGAYVVLGVLAGIVGPLFMLSLSGGERAFERVRLPLWARTAIGGALVGAIAILYPEVTGNGYEAIQRILDGHVVGAVLAALLLAKLVATVCSVSSGSPGGVLTPSMFLGAALGGLVGAGMQSVLDPRYAGTPGGYALVGMAAVVAATTHAPLMAAVLVFELSGDYAIVLPLLLATVVATLVARRFRKDSVYTEELRRRGVAWEGSVAERLARTIRARDVMEPSPPIVGAETPVEQVLALLEQGARLVYVADGARVRAIGIETAKAIWSARARDEAEPPAATAGDIATSVPFATPTDDLLSLNEKLWGAESGQVPVIEGGRVIGVVTRRALLAALHRELIQGGELSSRAFVASTTESLALPDGHKMELVPPPAWLVGRSPDAGELDAQFRVKLIGIRRRNALDASGAQWIDERGDHALDTNDRLLIVGSVEALAAFRRSRGPRR